MIVYVVTCSDYGIEAIFDTRERAERYCAEHPYALSIEKFDTEEYQNAEREG